MSNLFAQFFSALGGRFVRRHTAEIIGPYRLLLAPFAERVYQPRNFVVCSGVNIDVQMPNPRLIGLFVLACAAALYFGSTNWIETREYHPLNIPVSLAKGRTTHVFHVNAEGTYQLSIQAWPKERTPLRTTWFFGQNGHVVASGSNDIELGKATFIGSARLPPGFYTIEFHVLSDDGQLDIIQPRLDINADGDTYNAASDWYNRVVFAALVIGFVGGSVFLFLPRAKSCQSWSFGGAVLMPGARKSRSRGLGRRIGLPSFGYFAATLLALAMIGMMTLVSPDRLPSKGLWVGLLKPGSHVQSVDRWSHPLIVRVTTTSRKRSKKEIALSPQPYYDRGEVIQHFFIDGEEVPTEQFKAHLRGLLVTRADRAVYIQGSAEASFETVASAIDMARGSYTSRIILLTDSDPSLQQPKSSNRSQALAR